MYVSIYYSIYLLIYLIYPYNSIHLVILLLFRQIPVRGEHRGTHVLHQERLRRPTRPRVALLASRNTGWVVGPDHLLFHHTGWLVGPTPYRHTGWVIGLMFSFWDSINICCLLILIFLDMLLHLFYPCFQNHYLTFQLQTAAVERPPNQQ